MKKTEILINKPVHLGLSILELSKILMYEFWYVYVKPRYGEKVKLCYINTDSFIVYIKTELKHFNDSKACIEYSNDMDGIYENIEE